MSPTKPHNVMVLSVLCCRQVLRADKSRKYQRCSFDLQISADRRAVREHFSARPQYRQVAKCQEWAFIALQDAIPLEWSMWQRCAPSYLWAIQMNIICSFGAAKTPTFQCIHYELKEIALSAVYFSEHAALGIAGAESATERQCSRRKYFFFQIFAITNNVKTLFGLGSTRIPSSYFILFSFLSFFWILLECPNSNDRSVVWKFITQCSQELSASIIWHGYLSRYRRLLRISIIAENLRLKNRQRTTQLGKQKLISYVCFARSGC